MAEDTIARRPGADSCQTGLAVLLMVAGLSSRRLIRPSTAADEDADAEEEPSFLPPFANAENRALDAHIRVCSTGTIVTALAGCSYLC